MNQQGQQAAFIVNPGKIQVPSASRSDPAKLYGQPWTSVQGRQAMFGTGFESKLGDIITLKSAYNYTTIWRKNNGMPATLLDNTGRYSATYSDAAPQGSGEHSAYALADARFETGEIRNSAAEHLRPG